MTKTTQEWTVASPEKKRHSNISARDWMKNNSLQEKTTPEKHLENKKKDVTQQAQDWMLVSPDKKKQSNMTDKDQKKLERVHEKTVPEKDLGNKN